MNQLQGRVFITGGAGFIARAIYLRARREGWPVTFTAFGHHGRLAALKARFPEVEVVAGDVASGWEGMAGVMKGHDLVIHAAADKHVDISEFNTFAAVETNIVGSRNVAYAAMAAQVPKVLAISTDKACEPVNLYGMTKAVMERLWAEANQRLPGDYYCVRYGNVIGSTGSVATVWRRQLEAHEPITITDPSMTRFWMTADEAIEAILATLAATPGRVYVPTPAAATVMTLVHAAVGVVPESNIVIAGKRPGEKQHEALIGLAESDRAVVYDLHFELVPPGQIGAGERFSYTSDDADIITAGALSKAIREAEEI